MATVVVVVALVVAIVVLVEAGSVARLTGVLSQDFWPFGLVALGLKDCGDIQCEN